VTLPVRALHELGVHTLIVTNAAGGINPTLRAGDLMLITDHLGIAAITGANPLWGPNDDALGPRFLDMSRTYDLELRRLALRVAARIGLPLRQGIYAGLAGPTFETPAEVRFSAAGRRGRCGDVHGSGSYRGTPHGHACSGISGIANLTIDDPDAQASVDHQEVLAAGKS